jgi:hypothetical protein|nr:MAG TPA: hypothetical protein [Caudoviricetes sp.]
MARPKKETIENTTNDVNVAVDTNTDTTPVVDNTTSDERDNKLAEQAEQIANLQAQLELLMRAQANTPMPIATDKGKRKMIKIISLVAGSLVLQGSRIITISKQFDSVTVTENEARIILSNMPNSARDGIFYVADADFVEENNLEDAYQTILDEKQLKTILSKNAKDVVEIYQNAPDAQKKIINDMIVDGRLMGIQIDANILVELGKLNGIDYLNIEQMEDVTQ